MEVLPPSNTVRAYHLTTADYAISAIALSRLKVGRISEVNDPFELFALNSMKQPVRKALTEFKEIHDARTGLLCFSEAWKNPVLWSHYADRHRGICLGFDIDAALDPMKVQYDTDKLRLTIDDTVNPSRAAIPKDVQKLLFVTKFAHWAYEQEVRVMVELEEAIKEGSLYFWPFSEQLRLKEVVLGALCSLPLERVSDVVKHVVPEAEVLKARLGFKYFEVKRDESAVVPSDTRRAPRAPVPRRD